MAGKLILIKAALSALPIFQSSLLLAPKSITSQISKILWDFLWNGGKGSQSKMHLVSWDTLKKPIFEGGLQIRDPRLSNLALGGKFLWQRYVDKHHLVGKIFRLKFLKEIPLRNLTSFSTPLGTTIWNLCWKGIDEFKQHLYRIPGNGNKVRLWEDKISGNNPLSSGIMFEELKI